MNVFISQQPGSAASLPHDCAEPFPKPAQLPARADLPIHLCSGTAAASARKKSGSPGERRSCGSFFSSIEYGYLPRTPERLESRLIREDPAAFGGKATLKEIEVRCTKPDAKVHLLVVIPNRRTAPAPCFLGMNFEGNYAVVADPQVQMPEGWVSASHSGSSDNRAAEEGRGKQIDTWSIEQSVDRGYAVATFYSGDVVPDQTELALERLKQFRAASGQSDAATGAATIACWAWGFSRMLDHLVTEPDIDAKRIAAVGHSRNGKTALLAAALDERFAMVIPSQAGCGGTAPSRVAPELAALQPTAGRKPRRWR
jgi:hypothetical protein